ncbi:TetR/AcrR family transcriptional regulator [Thermoactinospora rubra]|uniref:TetR/AcrR family transcriptional regulator n=1 Tax=Thermoactinospora rubra TaxID=1088767 RepID=UPI000A1185CF|nr:TetR/AcrR family transcriptional regulator [Thermoactinospora rubra]
MAPERDQLVLDAATRLFAALGFDGTSMEQIAQTADTPVQEIKRLFGGKRELYIATVERVYQAQIAAMQAEVRNVSCEDAESTTRSVHRLIDAYLDFGAEHPYINALWVHRWLSDAVDIAEIESRYARPIYDAVLGALRPAVQAGYIDPGMDLVYVLHIMAWSVHGFGQGGVTGRDGVRRGLSDLQETRRFRSALHRVIHRAVRLPGDYEPE